MTPDYALVLSAFGLLLTVEMFSLGVGLYNARKVARVGEQVGTDEQARTMAREAEDQAQYAHHRLSDHMEDEHDLDVPRPRPATDGGEPSD